jgi:hypothetical protein
VLQGSVDIASIDGPPTRMEQYWHAYVPANHWITLSNPKPYDGPGAPR